MLRRIDPWLAWRPPAATAAASCCACHGSCSRKRAASPVSQRRARVVNACAARLKCGRELAAHGGREATRTFEIRSGAHPRSVAKRLGCSCSSPSGTPAAWHAARGDNSALEGCFCRFEHGSARARAFEACARRVPLGAPAPASPALQRCPRFHAGSSRSGDLHRVRLCLT